MFSILTRRLRWGAKFAECYSEGVLTEDDVVVAYIDGACRGNPGPGGWGYLLICWGVETECSGNEPETTNNRMELMAAIELLERLPDATTITVFTDSTYVCGGASKWMFKWMRKDWKTKKGEPRKNTDLWKRLAAAAERHSVEWKWVRGHSGNPGNERADKLATQAIRGEARTEELMWRPR